MNNSMNLAEFATPLAAKDRFIKASFGGFSGSGKSSTASSFIIGCYRDMKITKPLLIIDNEKGSRFLVPKFKAAGIAVLVKDTDRLADVQAAFEFLKRGEIGFLFIDTLSKVWYRFVRDYKEKNHITFMALDHWGKILPAWQEEFADKFVESNGNIVFTGRGGFSYEKEDDEVNEATGKVKKGGFVKSDVKMKVAGETPFEPDFNVWMALEKGIDKKKKISQVHTAFVLKDRNDGPTSLDGKSFVNPKYNDFKPFIDHIMGIPIGDVAGPTSTENLAPSEDFGWYQRKEAREIQVEKIKALFDRARFSTSVADKELKVLVYEKVFGTTSPTEIEKFDAEKLGACKVLLEGLFVQMAKVEPDARAKFVQGWDPSSASDLPFDKPSQAAEAAQPTNGEAKKELLELVSGASSKKMLKEIRERANASNYEKRLSDQDLQEVLKAAEEKEPTLKRGKAA